jgi:hypothetical protein
MSYLAQFLESKKGVPSIRLACGLLLVLLVGYLEIRFATIANVVEIIGTDLLAVNGFFAIGAARLSAESFAARPPAPATQIKSESAEVNAAGNVNLTTNASNANPE